MSTKIEGHIFQSSLHFRPALTAYCCGPSIDDAFSLLQNNIYLNIFSFSLFFFHHHITVIGCTRHCAAQSTRDGLDDEPHQRGTKSPTGIQSQSSLALFTSTTTTKMTTTTTLTTTTTTSALIGSGSAASTSLTSSVSEQTLTSSSIQSSSTTNMNQLVYKPTASEWPLQLLLNCAASERWRPWLQVCAIEFVR
jgi:hypothetical protein